MALGTIYRSKPVEIEAVLYDGKNMREIVAFAGPSCSVSRIPNDPVFISTLEGTMRGEVGDYIIRGLRGEYYPCKPDVFAAKYEAVE